MNNDIIENSFISDEELAIEAQQGSAESFELLLTRYKPLVRSQAGRYYLSGGDHDDLIQEGMIGLLKAVRVYNIRSGNPFSALAKTTVHNTILDAMRRDQAAKQRALNESQSLSWSDQGKNNSEDSIMTDRSNDSTTENGSPLSKIEAREAAAEILAAMADQLSSREMDVLVASIRGQNIAEISKSLNLDSSQVNSALARARKKLRDKLFT